MLIWWFDGSSFPLSFVDRDMVMLFKGGGVGHSIRYDDGGVSGIVDPVLDDKDDEELDEPDWEPPLPRRSSRNQVPKDDSDGSQEESDEDPDENSDASELECVYSSEDEAEDNKESEGEGATNISDDGYGSP
jgi:hypothetical protein